jgi:hypothetical protein
MGNTGWSRRPQTERDYVAKRKGRHPSEALTGPFVHEVKELASTPTETASIFASIDQGRNDGSCAPSSMASVGT